jgi:hypothetical protein
MEHTSKIEGREKGLGVRRAKEEAGRRKNVQQRGNEGNLGNTLRANKVPDKTIEY